MKLKVGIAHCVPAISKINHAFIHRLLDICSRNLTTGLHWSTSNQRFHLPTQNRADVAAVAQTPVAAQRQPLESRPSRWCTGRPVCFRFSMADWAYQSLLVKTDFCSGSLGENPDVVTSPAGKSLKPALKDFVAAQRFPAGKQNVMTPSPGDVTGGSLGIHVPSCFCYAFGCPL